MPTALSAEPLPASPETAGAPAGPLLITIVGAGALGLAMAAALARSGNEVTIMARPASASALREVGLVTVSGQFDYALPTSGAPPRPGRVGVTGSAADLPAADVVLFTAKGQDLPAAIDAVAATAHVRTRPGWFVAGFQNGVVKDELLGRAFGPDRVVGAATVMGARRLSAGSVAITSLGTTLFGDFTVPEAPAPPGTVGSAPSARAARLAAAFVAAGLPCAVVADARSMLWSKFANAVGVFGVTAITGLPTAQMFARPPLALAYRALLQEAASVAAAEGTEVGDFPDLPMKTYAEQPVEEFLAAMAARPAPPPGAPPGYSSMAQDLAAGRPTEVDQIFGDLVRRAEARAIGVPLSQMVYRLITGLEAR